MRNRDTCREQLARNNTVRAKQKSRLSHDRKDRQRSEESEFLLLALKS